MADATWDQLEAFAREELGKPIFGGPLKLTPDSRIEEDLRLTGLDAVEFIDKWAETFSVEAQGFPYNRYFGPESLDIIKSVLGLFSKKHRDPELVPLTLGMLAEAMRRGRWNTAEIEAWAGERN
ncbi:acyl carrier protein [Burkholderia sp. SRS-46]|nr:acyl carrier protein [Burkholderia sp. SRS-46]